VLRDHIAGGADGLVQAARLLAEVAHEGQVDKAGQPYTGHPERVAGHVKDIGGQVEAVTAAWLHDTVEDTWVTPGFLAEAGFPHSVISAVDAVTKRTGEPTQDYVARITADPLAVMVKRADLADNTDPRRLGVLDPTVRARLTRKYQTFTAALDAAVRGNQSPPSTMDSAATI
jgi:(p)ppGpp synthase/HD superfamily hydrolase